MKRRVAFLLTLALLALFCGGWAEELTTGARGDEVLFAQGKLRELNYLEGAADGVFGNQTATAIRLFQEANGLAITGTLNGETRAMLSSEAAKPLPAGVKKGDEGEAVQALQLRLQELGYLDGEADGKYGKKTEQAVKAFQKLLVAQGVAVEITGQAGSVTRMYLENEGHSTWVQDFAPGAEDQEILRMEIRLRDLGYLDAQPDEKLDEYASRAVKAFQRAEGLKESGAIDKETVDRLFSSSAKRAEVFVSHDIWEGDEGMAVEALQEILARYGMLESLPDGNYGQETAQAVDRFYQYLLANDSPYAEQFALVGGVSASAQDLIRTEDFFFFHGEVGEDSGEEAVFQVQRRLHSLYYVGESSMTGTFGSITQAAIESFQENNNLEKTGRADEPTLKRLFSPAAVGNWTKYLLKISIEEQRVYVYALNTFNEYELEKTMICSTGLGNTTPKGVFLKTQPLNRWHYFKKFECWAQYSYQIEGDILFHSVLYSQRSEKTLRYGSVYALGRKASHGCVRLKVEDAKWIYENCERRTVVVVV